MVSRITFSVCLLAALVLSASATESLIAKAATPAEAFPTVSVMPWFCLQRCQWNISDILHQATNVIDHSVAGTIAFNTIAFERFNLGANSTLVDNNDLFDLNSYLKKQEITRPGFRARRIAMVSSYPYPPQFIEWMREVFAKPEPFINALLQKLVSEDIQGVNIDWEPAHGNPTAEDATNYAAFLRTLKLRLAAKGKVVTVAAGTWSAVWNLTEMSAALRPEAPTNLPGYATMMNTYTYENSVFDFELATDMNAFTITPAPKNSTAGQLVVGVETWPVAKESDAMLSTKFASLAKSGICRLAVWSTPIDARWVKHLTEFTTRCKRH